MQSQDVFQPITIMMLKNKSFGAIDSHFNSRHNQHKYVLKINSYLTFFGSDKTYVGPFGHHSDEALILCPF